MDTLERIRQLYQDYVAEIKSLEANRKLADGLLGIGRGPADHPCNDRFAGSLEAELKKFADQPPAPGETKAVLELIYQTPLEHQSLKTAYWMLLAVQGLTLELIPALSAEEAEALWRWYSEAYPRWDRLPVQNQVLKKLNVARKKG